MRLAAILKQKCPHCLQGPVFNSFLGMHQTCSNCHIKYEREDGYFMMSVVIGYAIGGIIALPICLILYLMNAPTHWYFIATIGAFILLFPLIFRYAKLLWLHIDEVIDPRPQ